MKNRNTRILSAFAIMATAWLALTAAAANAQTVTTTYAPIMVTYSSPGPGTAGTGLPNFLGFSDLTVGSSGPQVFDLQGFLGENGFFTAVPTGYFGSITKASLQRYQASSGVPSTGYFGPLTRSAMAAWMSAMAARVLPNRGVTVTTNNVSTGVSGSSQQPHSPTGYWYNGNWYGVVPSTGTNISGYWVNGTWTAMPSVSTSVSQSNATINSGYWYNGTWYPTSSSVAVNGPYGTASSSDMYGISTSHWDPSMAIASNQNGQMRFNSCGYETLSNGTVAYVCR